MNSYHIEVYREADENGKRLCSRAVEATQGTIAVRRVLADPIIRFLVEEAVLDGQMVTVHLTHKTGRSKPRG